MRISRFQIWRSQAVSGWKPFHKFLACDRGVVSLEWVAIAAVLAIGAIAIAGIVLTGLAAPANNICTQLGGTVEQCAPPASP